MLFNQQSRARRWARFVLAGVCLAGCVCPLVTAAGQTVLPAQHARLLGPVTLIAEGAVYRPGGLTVDNAGNIYVPEDFGQDILKIPYSGGVYGTPVKIASGSSFSAVALDGAGNLYIAGGAIVQKVSYSNGNYGAPVTIASGFRSLNAIKLDGAGNIYVADSGTGNGSGTTGGAVEKIPFSGSGYGTPVMLGSGWSTPEGVAVDPAGNVYVADLGNNMLKVIPYSGGTYGTPVVIYSNFNYLGDLTLDPAGNLYVNDSGYVKELQVYGNFSSGVYNSGYYYGLAFILAGSNEGSLALDSAGNIYSSYRKGSAGGVDYAIAKIGPVQPVIDFGASNVGLASPITKTLNFSIDIGGTIEPPFVVTQGSPSLDFADTGTGTCTTNGSSYNYNSNGDVCTVVVSFTPAAPGVRNGAVVITGAQLVSNIGGGGSGATGYQPTAQLATATLQGTGTGAQVTYPPGLAPNVGTFVTNHGAVNPYMQVSVPASNGFTTTYVSEYPNGSESGFGGFQTSSLSGSGGTSGDLSCGACSPRGLAVDQTGRLIFSDVSDNTVKLFTSYDPQYSGTPLTVATGFYQPMGVAVDAVGNIYVADTNNSVIKKIPYIASGLDPHVPAAYQYDYGTPVVLGSGFNYPQGVAVDAAGNVYVSDTYNNAVKKIPYSGGMYGTPVLVASGLNYPAGIVLDGGGNIYVADQGSNSVKKIPYSGGSYGAPVTLNNAGLNGPVGLSIDGSGNLTVTEPDARAIATIDLSDAPTLSFPNTAAGSTSASQTVTIANSGNYPLTLVPPAAGYNPSVPANFSLGNSSTCPQVSSMASMSTMLAAGASCTEVLSFAPTASGSIAGALTVSDKLSIPSATVTQSVALSGKATLPVPIITVPPVTIVYGATTTLTATLSLQLPAPPDGFLIFQVDGGAMRIGTCTGTNALYSCQQTYDTSTLSVGSHTITVMYNTDQNYATASNTATLTVSAPTANVTVAPVTIPYGTATAMLSGSVSFNGPAPQNSLNFKVDNGSVYSSTCTLAAQVLSCTVASYATAGLSVGPHTITAGLNDANYSSASNTGTLTVTAVTPVISVATVSTTYGAPPTTLSASIAYTGPTVPTGAVSFKVDGGAAVAATCSGTSSPRSCSASYSIAALTTGGHTVTVSIAADANYVSATNTGSLTITPVTPAVQVTPASTTYGMATTALSANVIYLGQVAPTGAVSFKVDSGTPVTAICSGVASPLSCSAMYSTVALSAGPHTITVATAADTNYTATSTGGTLTVNPATPSVTVPAVSSTYGATATTLSATIAYAASSGPTGAVLFKVDGGASAVGSCSGATSPLVCSASYATGALTTGPHTITVSISADTNYVATSNTAALTVAKQGTVITLGANPTSITPVQTTTLTATVSAAVTGSPTGTVTFYDNGAPLGSPVVVSGGQAQLSTSLLSGAHTLSATYSGDANYTGSTATAGTSVTVAPLDFSLGSTTALSFSVVPGSTGTVSFNVAPLYLVYPGPVSFSVSGLPPGATYTITPTSIPANGGAQTVTVTIQTRAATAKNILPAPGAPIALALFVPLLALGTLRRRRRWLGALVLVAGLFAGSAVVGCGANTGNGLFGQAPQTYPVVITVTSGTMQHTINVTLQVL
jgi:sugar lactone lactonase YvrE